jgi:hypothetical protein
MTGAGAGNAPIVLTIPKPVSNTDPYLVVIRAISAAHLPFDEPLVVQMPDAHCEVKS